MNIRTTNPELEELNKRRLETGAFRDAEEVIPDVAGSSIVGETPSMDKRRAAIKRLASFGKRHGLSLGGLKIKDLINEGRR
jgi:hypothetical protein